MNATAFSALRAEVRVLRARARQVANGKIEAMRLKLEDTTPEEMGWPDISPEDLVVSEWWCWYRDEIDIGRKDIRASLGA